MKKGDVICGTKWDLCRICHSISHAEPHAVTQVLKELHDEYTITYLYRGYLQIANKQTPFNTADKKQGIKTTVTVKEDVKGSSHKIIDL